MYIKSTLFFLFLAMSVSLHAGIIIVDNLMDNGTGTFRQAILDANASAGADTIIFSVTGPIVLASNTPEITEATTINAAGITIDGNDAFRGIFTGSGTEITINDLTITNCRASQGAGILHGSGTLILNRCILDGNAATDDGGAILSRGTMFINETTVSNNTAVDDGGGVRGIGGMITWVRSLISNNVADDTGGGVIINSSGGVGGTMTFINTTVSGNSAIDGAGIRIASGSAIVRHSTIAFNIASDDGGGIALHSSSSLTISHSIVANNTAVDRGPDLISYSNTPMTEGFNILGINANSSFTPMASDSIGTSGTPVDPLIATLADNGGPTQTHALNVGSPALDQGGSCQVVDQRQYLRTDGNCDIGAFENSAVAVEITGRDSSICSGESVDLSTLISGMPAGKLLYGESYDIYNGTAVVSPTSNTTYFIADSVENGGIVDTAMITITVNPQPSISGASITVCQGDTVDLSTLVVGIPINRLEYGTVFGTYVAGDSIIVPMSDTTIFVRDSSSTTMCADTAMITISVKNDISCLMNFESANALRFGDPCNCEDVVYIHPIVYFRDTLMVDAPAGQSLVYTTTGSSDLFDENGTPLADMTPFEEVSNGMYELEIFKEAGVQPVGNVLLNGEGPIAIPADIIGVCERGACPNLIPTLGQWGIIVLGMALFIFGIVALKAKKTIYHLTFSDKG